MLQRLRGIFDSIPFGLAPSAIIVVTLLAGLWLLAHPIACGKASLRYWTFTHISYEGNRGAIRDFEKRHPGVTVDQQLVHITAVTSRLRAAFWADLDVPDLVEVEIGRAGSFFRGPVDDVGFVDLTPWIERDRLMERIVPARFAPYTNRGKIFGLPLDIHPVMLAYRRDLLEEAGVDVADLRTWDDFVRIGRQLTIPGKRYMLQLSETTSGHLEMMLFQRGGGYFDIGGNLIMDNEIGVQTLKFYVSLIAGPDRIATDLGSGAVFTQALEQGYFLFIVTPDWMSYVIENDVPRVSGKMALAPLPAWGPGQRRTSTLGGTMLAITKHCQDPDLAWELMSDLYLDPAKLAARLKHTNIIAPLREAWNDPLYSELREYWSGQPIGKLYADLAPEVPPQYTSPFIELAKLKMGEVLAACAAYYKKNGDEGFDAFARERLKAGAEEVRAFMKRNRF